MNIIVRYNGPRPRSSWQELVETRLRKLKTLATIQTTRVAIESQRRVKHAFRVMALLEVPGPDFHAEACVYTPQAALAKVAKCLERQIRSRKNRRANKRKIICSWGSAPVIGHRA